MFIRNRMASLIYKLCIAVVCLVGLLMNTGLLNGTFAPYVMLYYTVLSNLMCLIFYITASIVTGLNIKNTGKFGVVRFVPHFKGAIVMSMVLTTLVYFFILSDSPFANVSVFAVISNVLVHLIVPLMVVVDWALFDRKGRFFGSDPIIWMVVPFVYYSVVLVAAQLGVQYYGGTSYPYRFIDPNRIGWAPVLVNVFLLTMAYMLLGYVLMGVDRYLGNRAKKKALEAAEYLPEVKAQAAAQSAAGSAGPDDLHSLDDFLGGDRPAAGGIPAGQAPQPTAVAQPVASQQAAPQTAMPAQAPRPAAPVAGAAVAGAAAANSVDKIAAALNAEYPTTAGQSGAVAPDAPAPGARPAAPAPQQAAQPMAPRPAAPATQPAAPGAPATPPVAPQPAPGPQHFAPFAAGTEGNDEEPAFSLDDKLSSSPADGAADKRE